VRAWMQVVLGRWLGRQFGVCIPPFETPAAVAGKPHAAGAQSIESIRFSRLHSSITDKPISVQTRDYGACGLGCRWCWGVVRNAVWCMYPSVRDTNDSCWQHSHLVIFIRRADVCHLIFLDASTGTWDVAAATAAAASANTTNYY
jgi:hypothetical protein